MAKQQGRIVGDVRYAEGDGPTRSIRRGPCEIDVTALDATISWRDGDVGAVAALPLETYTTWVDEGRIVVD